MNKINDTTIIDIESFFSAINTISKARNKPIWFRGVGNADFKLIPSIFRNPKIKTSENMVDMESNLLHRFKERSLPYLDQVVEDDWYNLFLMQHYGVPTRLLDWTESPIIALFFALSSARKNTDQYDNDAAVWVFDPYLWNSSAFNHLGWGDKGPISIANNNMSNSYSPNNLTSMKAAAIYGIHNSPRIVAQRGSFTVHGKNIDSIDEQFKQDSQIDPNTLSKLIIDRNQIDNMLNQLIIMGMTDAVIYPDLSGLALETRRVFGYGV